MFAIPKKAALAVAAGTLALVAGGSLPAAAGEGPQHTDGECHYQALYDPGKAGAHGQVWGEGCFAGWVELHHLDADGVAEVVSATSVWGDVGPAGTVASGGEGSKLQWLCYAVQKTEGGPWSQVHTVAGSGPCGHP